IVARPDALVRELAGVVAALLGDRTDRPGLRSLVSGIPPEERHRRIAERLAAGGKKAVLLGNTAITMEHGAALRHLAAAAADLSGASFGFLGDAPNAAGAWLAGAVPHRGPGGKARDRRGMNALTMLGANLPAYILFGAEPEADSAWPAAAVKALEEASLTVVVTPWKSAQHDRYADVLLPSAVYAENEGTYVNVEGRAQTFECVVPPQGEARQGWKILRVLANHLGLSGFDHDSIADVRAELSPQVADVKPDNSTLAKGSVMLPEAANGLVRWTYVPMFSTDPLVRRAPALQQMPYVADGALHVSPGTARSLGLEGAGRAVARQNGSRAELPVTVDERLADGVVLLHGGNPALAGLGAWYGAITLEKA